LLFNLPILIKSKTDLGTVGIPNSNNGKGAVFLLNTGEVGNTQPLVQHFLERCKEEGFRKMLKNKFKKYNDASIDAFLKNEGKSLLKNVKSLSKVLYENFQPMIPKLYRDLWKEGIDTNSYYLKLCGSGGGGYILGFTKDLKRHKLNLVATNLMLSTDSKTNPIKSPAVKLLALLSIVRWYNILLITISLY
jgi:mevalonate kinase